MLVSQYTFAMCSYWEKKPDPTCFEYCWSVKQQTNNSGPSHSFPYMQCSCGFSLEVCCDAGVPVHICYVLLPGKETRPHRDDAAGRLHCGLLRTQARYRTGMNSIIVTVIMISHDYRYHYYHHHHYNQFVFVLIFSVTQFP